jgi:hypothetical protein
MAAQRRFPSEAYGSYHQAALPPADDTLVRVGPGTLGGEYLRRFWHPVAQSEMVKDLPVAIRIFGEDLVVFRDRGGAVGLLDRHCMHRGTSLEYGRSRSAASAAATTAGSSTSTARSSRRRRSPMAIPTGASSSRAPTRSSNTTG